jgi:hypothetical protein
MYYNYVFAYTASLVLEQRINEATGQLWTADERTAEAMRLYPDAFLHPQRAVAADYRPPGLHAQGQGAPVACARSLLCQGRRPRVQNPLGWVHNPQSLARFRYYINNRSAAA